MDSFEGPETEITPGTTGQQQLENRYVKKYDCTDIPRDK